MFNILQQLASEQSKTVLRVQFRIQKIPSVTKYHQNHEYHSLYTEVI